MKASLWLQIGFELVEVVEIAHEGGPSLSTNDLRETAMTVMQPISAMTITPKLVGCIVHHSQNMSGRQMRPDENEKKLKMFLSVFMLRAPS